MSNIDNYYRSALVFTQGPPTTETLSSNFNYSTVENQYGSDLLLYTGLIPSSNPLTAGADGDKYSAQGIDIVEKVSLQTLTAIGDSIYGFTDDRLTYLIPGSVYGITVWSKDQAGAYTVEVPTKYYDVFFYPPTGTYAIYFKEKYAPMYQGDGDLITLQYPPAITCYRYCGPKGIENTPAQIGVGTYIDGGQYLSPGTGLYNTVFGEYKSWIYVENGYVVVPPGSPADKFTTESGYSDFQKYILDFGTSVCVADKYSPYMKQTFDGITWTDRDLTIEEEFANTRLGNTMFTDPVTHEVYDTGSIFDGAYLKFNGNSATPIEFSNIEGYSYVYFGSSTALNGVFSTTVEYPGYEFKRLYTTDFVTFNEGSVPSGFFDYAGNTQFRILSPEDGIIFAMAPVSSPTKTYISTDNGINYSEFTPPSSLDEYSRLSYYDGTYILSKGTANTVYRSTDLITWSSKSTNFSASGENNYVQSIGSGNWIAFQSGTSTTEISVSTDDGLTWSVTNLPTAGYSVNAFQFGSKYYLFSYSAQYATTQRVFSSTDLETWSLETSFSIDNGQDTRYYYRWTIGSGNPSGGSLGMRYTIFNGKLIIAAGSSIKTYDGTTWSSRTDSWNTFPYNGGILKIK